MNCQKYRTLKIIDFSHIRWKMHNTVQWSPFEKKVIFCPLKETWNISGCLIKSLRRTDFHIINCPNTHKFKQNALIDTFSQIHRDSIYFVSVEKVSTTTAGRIPSSQKKFITVAASVLLPACWCITFAECMEWFENDSYLMTGNTSRQSLKKIYTDLTSIQHLLTVVTQTVISHKHFPICSLSFHSRAKSC